VTPALNVNWYGSGVMAKPSALVASVEVRAASRCATGSYHGHVPRERPRIRVCAAGKVQVVAVGVGVPACKPTPGPRCADAAQASSLCGIG